MLLALGVVLIAGSLQRYIVLVGFLDREGAAGTAGRTLAAIGGGFVALPGVQVFGLNMGDTTLFISGGVLAIAGILLREHMFLLLERQCSIY